MTETSSLNRSWLIRMGIIIVVFLGFGVWGWYDATIAYPERGIKAAEFMEKEYLAKADEQGRLMSASVPEPVRTHAVLRTGATNELDAILFRWLDALSIVGRLSEEHTTFADPAKRLAELQTSWGSKKSPKPLSALDIPTQYLIMVTCTVIGLIVLGVVIKVSRLKYTFDPATNTLTLPGGHTLTPDDLAEIDKRKWHKFIVFLNFKPEHATLGSKSVKVDLLRHAKVEQWILAMEAIAFPDSAKPAPSTDAPLSEAAQADAGTTPDNEQSQSA